VALARRDVVGVTALSLVLSIGLLVALVDLAGAWEVAANTRVLDLLLRGGLVQLTDMDAGYVAGVPDHELFLRSQDPLDWGMLVGAAALIAVAHVARALGAGSVAVATGAKGSRARGVRLPLYTQGLGQFLPFRMSDAATARALETDGNDESVARATVRASRLVQVGEVVIFAVVALLLVGMGAWIRAMGWSLVILLVAWLLTRPGTAADRRSERSRQWQAVRSTLGSLWRHPSRLAVVAGATLVALPLEELSAYLVVQGLTSEFVILGGLTPSILLMALVAGKTASLVPVTPGGIGQFEWGFTAALFTLGQGLAEAVTVTLVVVAVRYLTAALLVGGTAFGRGPGTRVRPALGRALARQGQGDEAPVGLRTVPRPSLLVRRLFVAGTVVLGLVLLERIRLLFVDYWLLESLGFEQVFWTDLRMKAWLFVIAGVLWALAVIGPGLRFAARRHRRAVVAVGAVVGVVAGVRATGLHHRFLVWRHGQDFGEVDPVFGYDIGFYTFDLPAIRTVVWGLFWCALAAIVVSALFLLARRGSTAEETFRGRLQERAARLADPLVLVLIGVAGTLATVGVWLRRFDVLTRDNYESSIATGAEALDVGGFPSTVSLAAVQAVAVVIFTAGLIVWLRRCRNAPPGGVDLRTSARLLAPAVVLVVVATGLVLVRDAVSVTPNEPVAQLEYLDRHISATNRAWGMDEVERVDVAFNEGEDPLPDIDTVIDHPSVQNAQLWSGSVSWLERLLDPQHVNRISLEADERSPDLVFGATLDTFRQQQKLRPYYDFLDVDVVNYPDGETPRLLASSVRELPLLEPQPWLAFWGQRFVLFTHGHGLVAAPLGEVGEEGSPVYLSSEVPATAEIPELETDQPAVYYGEGSGTIGFSNIRDVPEFDYPTEQDRADIFFPEDVEAGIRLDSVPKRLAFAWGTREFFGMRSFLDLAFSDLITDDTRLHYRRQPLDRVAAVAPFLYLDSDPYAVTTDEGIEWLVNGITVSDRYPYSAYGDLGDKSVRRGPFPADVQRVNYAADAVKATVDAHTGEVTLYQISDEPVVSTWAAIYPDLFTPAEEMPEGVREQLQYPQQLFHTQYDDLWIYYHVEDPLAFFNQEDLFDDADEVLGPMLEPGKGITFSMEPFGAVVETGATYPASDREHQFAWTQVFTPEGARNLRAMVSVYQQGDDYGRTTMLQLPKGSFVTSPEQAESLIDQDADIAQQFGFWNSTGVEVIRGYITPVVVDNELIYVEPVFIRSAQNPYPQLSRVVAVVRGHAAMAESLEEALTDVYAEVEGERPDTGADRPEPPTRLVATTET
jgi:uncharacterized membrane protein (UPF0182 family)/uncharacterized membrane protein YbhN (UPF0104 family)